MELSAKLIFDTILEKRLAINPLVVAAQTYHETGGYKHCCGRGNTNLAGVKSSQAWMRGDIPWSTKMEISLNTQEYRRNKDGSGKYVTVQAKFRWYGDDFLLCLRDIERIIITKEWFHDAYINNDCCWAYLSGLIAKWSPGPYSKLIEPGWATGHKYYESVARAMVKFAPRLLGPEWKVRLSEALDLASSRVILTKEQFLFVHNLLQAE